MTHFEKIIEEDMKYQFRNKIMDQGHLQINEQVHLRVWNQVSNQISDQFMSHVMNQVQSQVESQLWGYLHDTFRKND